MLRGERCLNVDVRPADALLLLADPERLAIAGTLVADPLDVDALVARTGLDRRVVLVALGDLRSAGLVHERDGAYTFDRAALRTVAREVTEQSIPMDPSIGFGMTDAERAILERYFSGRVLDEIPQQRAKFQIVLQRLALEFDLGRRYSEAEVNDRLHPFNTDWSTLRRGLVDEGYLDREHVEGVTWYWRSGGRVDV